MDRKGAGMVSVYVSTAIFFTFLVFGLPSLAKAEEGSVTLDFATFLPPVQPSLLEISAYFKELEKATGGKVKTRFHYSGAMGKPVDHYELALKGMADISHICIPYLPGTFPSFDIFGLPIHVPNVNAAEIMTKAILEMQKRGYFDEDFANVKLLCLESITPFQIQMGRDPITTLDQIKGKKLRVTGLYLPKLFQAMGATTVFTPASEVYIALQKGVVEGVVIPWPAQVDFKLYEVTKYVTQFDMSYAPYATVMNKAKWEKLPDVAKKFLTENASKLSMKSAARWEQFDKDAVALFQKNGGKAVQFGAAEWEKLAKVCAPMWQEWISAAEKKKFPAKKQAKELNDILTKLGVKDPFVGYKP